MKRNWKNAGGKCVDELKRKQKEGDQEGDRKGKTRKEIGKGRPGRRPEREDQEGDRKGKTRKEIVKEWRKKNKKR